MQDYLLFLLLGLGGGAVIAALAQGVVLAYRGSGVVNFAQGAMAMYAAYVYASLRNDGDYPIPPLPNPLVVIEAVSRWVGSEVRMPDIPTTVGTNGPMGFWPAFVLAIATGVALGALVYLLVLRPLRRAPSLAKVVVTIGVTLTLQAIVVIRFGTAPRNVQQVLYDEPIDVLGTAIPADRFILAGIVLALAAALAALYRWTKFGLATRAAQENEVGASLIGLSPILLGAVNWMLASALAAVVGVLAAPITALTPLNFVLFIIPALAAALLGRLTSFWWAAVAGLALGMVDSMFILLTTRWAWFPDFGAREAFPFLVVIVVMFVLGRSLPERGADVATRLPRAPVPQRIGSTAVGLAAVAALLMVVAPFGFRGALLNSSIGAVIALSLVVLVGFAGQISLAQLTYAGVAAFSLSTLADDWGIPFPFSPLLAALAAAGVGLVTAVPALRARGEQLAVITLAFGYAMQELVFANPEITGGDADPTVVPAPSFASIRFGPNDSFVVGRADVPNPGFGIFVVIVVALVAVAVAHIRVSATGRRLLAVRGNERAAAAAGVNVGRAKLTAFGLAAFIAGIGGALIGYRFEGVSADPFAVLLSLTALATAYLGGITSVSGALVAGGLAVGGVVFYGFGQTFEAGEYEILIAGLGLIVTALLNPQGIAGAVRGSIADAKRRAADRQLLAPPVGPAIRARPRG